MVRCIVHANLAGLNWSKGGTQPLKPLSASEYFHTEHMLVFKVQHFYLSLTFRLSHLLFSSLSGNVLMMQLWEKTINLQTGYKRRGES